MIDFNINDYVIIKLTTEGRQILRDKAKRYNWYEDYEALTVEECDELVQKHFSKIDSDGWITMQMWQVMSIFGKKIFMGCKPPFETTIRLQV